MLIKETHQANATKWQIRWELSLSSRFQLSLQWSATYYSSYWKSAG